MANSYTLYNGNGATTDFTVSPPYISQAHVSLQVSGVTVAATWVSTTTLRATVAPAVGVANVKVKRVTPKTSLVTFSDSSGLTAADLNLQGTQARYIAEEQEDAYLLGGLTDLSVATLNLQDGVVTLAKMANLDTRKVIGRLTPSTGVPEAVSPDDLKVITDGSTAERDLSARFADIRNVRDFGALGDGTTNDTAAIQAAIDVGSGIVVIPKSSSFYRADTMIVVKAYVTVMCYGEVRRVTAAAAVTPVVNVRETKAEWIGGRITTEKAHAGGLVILGHDSTAAAYTTTSWMLADCQLTGVQSAGNLGIRIVNAQSLNPINPANYFGTVRRVQIIGADVGLQAEEVSNAHRFDDMLFWNCITAGFRFYGAYACVVSGGFVHTGTNGIIGIAIENARSAQPHNSDNNYILGLGVEPTGAASKGFTIGTNCILNHLVIDDNCTGGNTISNTNNFYNGMFVGENHPGAAIFRSTMSIKGLTDIGSGVSNGALSVRAADGSSPQIRLGNAAGVEHWAMYQTLSGSAQGSFKIADALAGYVDRFEITTGGNLIAGLKAALATTATNGFLYVPTCAGVPTGTPTAFTGMSPIVVNTTANKLYFYSTGAWRDASL